MHQQSIYDVLGAPARAAERFFHARGRWNVSGKTRSDIQDFSGYLAKLALSFNKEERSWFVDNFARHMKYRSNPGTFVIGIDDIVKWLEFTQKNLPSSCCFLDLKKELTSQPLYRRVKRFIWVAVTTRQSIY